MAVSAVAMLLTAPGASDADARDASPPVAAAPARPRPNVVVFVADDMRADELRHLPAARYLQRHGVRFTRARSGDSLCCPARATLLTGMTAHNHRTIGNDHDSHGGLTWFLRHNDERDLLGPWMRRRGYRTGWIGKYLNDVRMDPEFDQPGWTYFATLYRNIYNYHRHTWTVNGRPRRTSRGYRETHQRRLLLDLLRRWGPRRRPYFVVYNSLAPHSGFRPGRGWVRPVPEPRFAGTVPLSSIEPRPSVAERSLRDKPRWVRSYARDTERGFRRALERRRLESLKSLDVTMWRAIRTARRQGELARTLFVMVSDNGNLIGEHGLLAKNKPYEESTRIPFVVSGPGFRGGVTRRQEVSLVDLAPTILRAAGARRTLGYGVDGVPLQPLARSARRSRRRPTLLEGSTAQITPGNVGSERLPTDRLGRFYTGVAFRDFVYVEYATGEREFYNLARDPYQLRNVYRRNRPPESPQRRLARWLHAHRACRGSGCAAPVPRPRR